MLYLLCRKNNKNMFQSLSDKLEGAFKLLKGENRLTEINIAQSIKEIRRALVAADVNYKIAKEYDLAMWQMYKYNDFADKKDMLEQGDIVYIEPKRSRARGKDATYIAPKETTLIEISQAEGIKLKSLVKMNGFTSEKVTVQKGQKILLR